MFACRSNTRARTKPDLTIAVLTFALLLAALLLPVPDVFGQTPGKTVSKASADSAAKAAEEEGFTVRVIEDGTSTTDRVRVRVSEKEPGAKITVRTEKRGGQLPEPPEPPEPPDLPSMHDNDLVRFGQDIEIPAGKVIEGDVIAIGGSVVVKGRVKGDCVSVGGSVSIEDGGAVEGDAVSVGGATSTSDSATVGGSNVSVGAWPFKGGHAGGMLPFLGLMGFGALAGFLGLVVQLAVTVFFAWLCLLLVRDRLAHATERMGRELGKSFLFGLLGWMAMVVSIPALVIVGVIAIVILCITIIGIPIAILLVIALVFAVIGAALGIVIAAFLGYVAGAMYLGQRLLAHRNPASVTPLKAAFFGILLILGLQILGKLMGFLGVVLLMPIGIAFGIASGVLGFVLMTSGLGAIILTRFAKGTDVAPSGAGTGPAWTTPAAGPAERTPQASMAPQEGGTSDAP